MSAVVGIPIQYAIVLDFDHFKQIIDFFGGVDVDVQRSFTDHKYQIAGKENDLCNGDSGYKCRYETISFQKGKTHMNGTQALKFVRSRHAEGVEGSDFSRNKRQQKVIEALQKKIVSLIKSFDVNQYKKFYEVINNSVKRDISNQQLALLVKKSLFSQHFSQKEAEI